MDAPVEATADAPVEGTVDAPVDTVDVFLQEYLIDMPGRIGSGSVIRLVNVGSEPHNLKVRVPGTDSVLWVSEALDPGTTQVAELGLPPGSYGVVCDLAGHDVRGMLGEVEVVGPRG